VRFAIHTHVGRREIAIAKWLWSLKFLNEECVITEKTTDLRERLR